MVTFAPRLEVELTAKSLIFVKAPSRSKIPVIVKSSVAPSVPAIVLAKLTVVPCKVLLPSVTTALV